MGLLNRINVKRFFKKDMADLSEREAYIYAALAGAAGTGLAALGGLPYYLKKRKQSRRKSGTGVVSHETKEQRGK